MNPNTPIDYRYLNMDTEMFCESNEILIEEIGVGALIKAFPSSPEYNQVLIAGGQKPFSDFSAIFLCKQISGLIPDRRPKKKDGV
jgi:hypothetical protein